jgi:hypothetical protein
MGKHDALTKTLAVVGTTLLVLPLVAPLVLGLGLLGGPMGYRVDYLMPFEVYPIALVGMALVLWASIRAHARTKAVGAAIAVMLGGFALAAVAAQVTGIANSEEELEAWRYAVTIGFAAMSLLGQAALAAIGALIARDSIRASHVEAPPVQHASGA